MPDSLPKKLISSDYVIIDIDESVGRLVQLLSDPKIDYIIISEDAGAPPLSLARYLRRKFKTKKYRYCLKKTPELVIKLRSSSSTDKIGYFLQQNPVEPATLIHYQDAINDIKNGGLLLNSKGRVAGVVNPLPDPILDNYGKLSELLTPDMRSVFEGKTDNTAPDAMLADKIGYDYVQGLPRLDHSNPVKALRNIRISKKSSKGFPNVVPVFLQRKYGGKPGASDDNILIFNEGDKRIPTIGFPIPLQHTDEAKNTKDPSWYLNVEAAPRARVNQEYPLLVSIDDTALANHTAALPEEVKEEAVVKIVVSAKSGFDLTDNECRELTVGKDMRVLFTLKPLAEGEGKIIVYAFLHGNQVACTDIRVDIVANTAAAPEPARPVAVAFSPLRPGTPADLSLFIKEEKAANGDILLTFTIIHLTPAANVYLREYKADPIKTDPQRYIQSMFQSIEALKLDSREARENAADNLKSKGCNLFEKLIPSELGVLLRKLKDQITTVIINSEEPWIPWELCRFTYEEDGLTKSGPFFCEQYQITRWMAGKNNPGEVIDLSRAAFVVPRDSNLPYAEKEKEKIQEMLKTHHCTVEDVLASTHELTRKLQEGVYSVFHFSGHGFFADPTDADQAYLILEDREKFSPENISGEIKNLGRAKPLVFFNACQVGRSAMSLTGIGGWAKQFLDAGAAAFIGTYWNVADQKAFLFATTLYEALLSGDTIGLAAHRARQAIHTGDGDPTWLAYTIYASPNATVSA